nr:hypothetical protein Itr_chr07CG09900 [Ipomoea trifida]
MLPVTVAITIAATLLRRHREYVEGGGRGCSGSVARRRNQRGEKSEETAAAACRRNEEGDAGRKPLAGVGHCRLLAGSVARRGERGSGDVAGSPLVVVEGTADGGPGSRSCLLLSSDAGAGKLSSLEGRNAAAVTTVVTLRSTEEETEKRKHAAAEMLPVTVAITIAATLLRRHREYVEGGGRGCSGSVARRRNQRGEKSEETAAAACRRNEEGDAGRKPLAGVVVARPPETGERTAADAPLNRGVPHRRRRGVEAAAAAVCSLDVEQERGETRMRPYSTESPSPPPPTVTAECSALLCVVGEQRGRTPPLPLAAWRTTPEVEIVAAVHRRRRKKRP